MKWISAWILRLLGWEVISDIPKDLKKFVVVVMPHTSNWDFPLGLLVRAAKEWDINYLGKKSLFRPPFGSIMRALGGYPVDRKGKQKFVDAVIALFESKDEFAVCITPEGTRSAVHRLKSGYYYIAKHTDSPIVMIKFDFANKQVVVAPPFLVGDRSRDTIEDQMLDFFKQTHGKRPHQTWDRIVQTLP